MSHSKIGQYTKSQLYSLTDGVYRLERIFYLRVRGNGKYRTYFFRYVDQEGNQKDCNIGSLRKITMADAKQQVHLFRSLLNIASPKNLDLSTNPTPKFSEFALQTIETLASVKLWKTVAQKSSWTSSITTYAFPKIGEKLVEEITRQDILEILKPIWTNKTMTASRLRGRLEKIFSYAINEGKYHGKNPAIWKANLEMYLPPPEKCKAKTHFKALTLQELRDNIPFLTKNQFIGYKCLLFGILTATRSVEFTQIQWSEIDFQKKIWNCPPSRRKDGKNEVFRVPLSRQLVEMLKILKKESQSNFVFTKDHLQPIRRETPRKLLKDGLKLDCTMHGMRSTFRDWCTQTGINEIVAEKSLMHSTGNEVVSAYQRSDLLEERRDIMQKWADLLLENNETTKNQKAESS